MENSEILIYQTPEGQTKIDVRLEDESVWLTQSQLADLFQTTKQNISLHIKNIYEEGELEGYPTVKEYLTVQREGSRDVKRKVQYYNLDVIISVGYRIKSHVGTHFRIWATQKLKEFMIKGFVLDDERLKQARNNYFDELLQRIRDIRSSEKVFYRKVCEIYATSMDYDPTNNLSREFFATVQNKFHWAIHGHTAAEVVYKRADAGQPNMGLTNWPGDSIKSNDVKVAKNYLNPEELDHLNRMVNQFLEFAELQALQRKPMHMKDWINKLHGFLVLNDREVLGHNGKVSSKAAESHALQEFEKYKKQLQQTEPDAFDKAVNQIKELKNGRNFRRKSD